MPSYFTVLIGQVQGQPVPPPKPVIDAIQSVDVTSSTGSTANGFQITFAVSKTSPIVTALIANRYFDPFITRVIIVVTVSGVPTVLMDGLVTHQEMAPSNDPGKSTFTVTGEDLSVAMDMIDNVIPYPNMPLFAQIEAVLAPYRLLGVRPHVIPPSIAAIKTSTKKTDTQNETDREFLRKTAEDVGFVFRIDPGPEPGHSIAYFGPEVSMPPAQPMLSIDFGPLSNVESLHFKFDGTQKRIRVFKIFDPKTGKIVLPVPVPNISILKPPLGRHLQQLIKTEIDEDSAKLKPAEAAQKILGFMMKHENSTSITANGTLDVQQYGQMLLSGKLVGVRGAGIAYDGLYFTDKVTHKLKPGEFKQEFELSRDGLVPIGV